MRALIFIGGYFFIATLGVQALSAVDPEPLGATIALTLFATVGLAVSCGAYSLSAALSHRSPGKFAAFAAGVLCATVLFGGLALTHFGVNNLLSLCAAALALVATALIAPQCSAA